MQKLLQKHSKKLLSVKNITVSINGLKLLQDVSFDLDQGDILSVIGPNGAGKTTLIKAILGLMPYSGSIELSAGTVKKNLDLVGYVPQRFDFDRTFPITVEEFLKLTYSGGDLENSKICDQLKVDDLYKKMLGELSGGQLQRVLIARAMLNDPKLLIFDEPTSGVDVGGQDSFYEIMSHLNSEHDVAIIMISHEINVVFKHSTRVLCLNEGKLCCDGNNYDFDIETLKKIYGENFSLHNHQH
jgi:zinc transport system ATP-binding protein